MLCWGRIASDSVCRRVLRNELAALASRQRMLLALLQKHLHLQEKVQIRKTISPSSRPHSVTKNQQPGLPSPSTAPGPHVSQLPKKQVVSQKGGKINRNSAPKQGVKVVSGPLSGPPGEATDRGKRRPHRRSNVGIHQRKTVNTVKDPVPPMIHTPVLREHCGTGRGPSVELSPGGALQPLWTVSLRAGIYLLRDRAHAYATWCVLCPYLLHHLCSQSSDSGGLHLGQTTVISDPEIVQKHVYGVLM